MYDFLVVALTCFALREYPIRLAIQRQATTVTLRARVSTYSASEDQKSFLMLQPVNESRYVKANGLLVSSDWPARARLPR